MEFKIDGKVQAKQRPRFSNGHTYTPKETVDYEQWVKLCFIQNKGDWECSDNPIKMTCNISTKRPKAHYNSKGEVKPQFKTVLPTKKPDTSNCVKGIEDALNGLVYHDDSQITTAHVTKRYTDTDYVIVTIVEDEL